MLKHDLLDQSRHKGRGKYKCIWIAPGFGPDLAGPIELRRVRSLPAEVIGKAAARRSCEKTMG